jgi:hypothetical protein
VTTKAAPASVPIAVFVRGNIDAKSKHGPALVESDGTPRHEIQTLVQPWIPPADESALAENLP